MRTAGLRWASIAVLATAMLSACDDDDAPDAGSGSTGEATGGTTSGAPSDDGDDSTSSMEESGSTEGADDDSDSTSTGADVSCAAPVLDQTFELDPSGVNGQIQPGVTFDPTADGVWVTYNAPSADGSGKFDVMVTRIGCDGAAQIDPTLVNRTGGDNDIDPELVRVGDDIIVAWSSDDGSGGDGNLSIRLQSLDLEGQPQLEEDRVLATTIDGAPFSGSAWMPRLSASASGEIAIVGTRAVEAASAFQVFVQRLDGSAQPVGDTVAFAPIVDVFHDTPHLVHDAAGDVVVAWVRTEDFELRQVELALAVDDAFEEDAPVLIADTPATGPALALTDGGALLAVGEPQGSGGRIRIGQATPGDSTTPAYGGDGSTVEHTPAIVAVPGGAAVAWYRNVGGLANEVWTGRVEDNGDSLVMGSPSMIPDAIAAPYATTMTHVGNGVVFVAWAQGDSPNFRVYGRFVAVE